MKHDFCNGKYTVEFDEATGDFTALRHGEPWRDLGGDKMILSMLQSIDAERKLLDRAFSLLEEMEGFVDVNEGAVGLATTFLQDVERLRRDILNQVEDQTGN